MLIIEADPDTVPRQQTNTTNDRTFNINNLGDAGPRLEHLRRCGVPNGASLRWNRTVATLNAKGIDGTAIGDASFTAAGTDTGVRATPESQANDLVTITQSVTNNIVQFNSVSCNAGGLHTDNSYLRVFDLMSYGVTDDFDVTEVETGVEQALARQVANR